MYALEVLTEIEKRGLGAACLGIVLVFIFLSFLLWRMGKH